MNNLTQRQLNILKSVVDAYIDDTEPVSSKLLTKKYYPDLSAATIRNEFQILEKSGYIYQPHTSAGRVPTNAGFKLFASSFFEDLDDEIVKMKKRFLEEFGLFGNSDFFLDELVEEISDLSDSFAAIGFSDKFHKYGLSELFRHLPKDTASDFADIAKDIENLEYNFYGWQKKLETEILRPLVFVGKESPITSNDNLSVIINKTEREKNKLFYSFIIGPKTMKYDKNLAIIKSIDELF